MPISLTFWAGPGDEPLSSKRPRRTRQRRTIARHRPLSARRTRNSGLPAYIDVAARRRHRDVPAAVWEAFPFLYENTRHPGSSSHHDPAYKLLFSHPQMVRDLLRDSFSASPASEALWRAARLVPPCVQQASQEQLEAWAERILDVQSIDALINRASPT